MIRKRLVISGRVQGVFFRETLRKEAERRGVSGSARNLDDGRVEVILEGDPERVAEVKRWCRQGPSMARVESVEETDETFEGLDGFATF
ncbi:MAG: acylphosphatase [Actinomycetota bacterium]|nr:acylphosphatase [Actinomycetota bacterium]